MHGNVIRGGEVVDGTGAAPRRADVAVDGDRITQVGAVGEPGRAPGRSAWSTGAWWRRGRSPTST